MACAPTGAIFDSMKKVLATLLGLLLVCAQVLMALPGAAATDAKIQCRCCGCAEACCVAPVPSAPQNQPVAPASVSVPKASPAQNPPTLAWVVPETALAENASGLPSSLPFAQCPLYERHCTLLI